MSEFSEFFSMIIRNKNLTVYNLSKITGVERTGLQKVLSGTRNMNIDSYTKIYEEIRNVVSNEELKKFSELYFEDYFGKHEYLLIKYITDRFTAISETYNLVKKVENNEISVDEVIDYYRERTKSVLLIEKLYEFMSTDTGDSADEIEVHINIPNEWYAEKSFLIAMLAQKRKSCNMNCTFINICESMDRDIIEVEKFMSACELALYNMESFYSEKISEKNGFLLPYYILYNGAYMFISSNGNLCIQNNNECNYKIFLNEHKNILKNYNHFIIDFNDKISEKVFLRNIIDEEGIVLGNGLVYDLTFGYGANKSIIVDKNIVNIDNELIEKLIDNYENSKEEIFMLKDNRTVFLGNIQILINEDMISIIVNEKKDEIVVGNISSKNLVNHFRNFVLYITNSDICLNRDKVLRLLKYYIEVQKMQ